MYLLPTYSTARQPLCLATSSLRQSLLSEFLDELHHLLNPFVLPPLSGKVHLPLAFREAEFVLVHQDGRLSPLYTLAQTEWLAFSRLLPPCSRRQ